MKSYLSRTNANKRLCKHCVHCEMTYPYLDSPRYMCGLKRSPVDDVPTMSCFLACLNPFICGGRKWELDKDISICETEEEVVHSDREAHIESFIPAAKKHIEAGTKPLVTCGYFDLAYERVLTTHHKSANLDQ